MKDRLLTFKDIQELNLSKENKEKILEKKRVGILFSPDRIHFQHKFNDGIVTATNPAKIVKMDPRSFLSKAGLKLGDYLLGFNKFQTVLKDGNGNVFLVNEVGLSVPLLKYIEGVEEGTKVRITYARKTSPSNIVRLGQKQEMVVYETYVDVAFLYDLIDFPEIQKEIGLLKIRGLADRIKGKLFHQDNAIDLVSKAVKIYSTGLKEDDKPIGGYLLLGPTGTGKTELAKLIAKEMDFDFIRIDMSEYGERHNVARLLGSPPGYVGYDSPTILEQKIGSKGTKAVLLLDEFEKAHPDIEKTFLQVLDNKKLTLGNGKTVDFGNVLILMTSNAGISRVSSMGLGGDTEKKKLSVDMEAIRKRFSPEFIGRLSGVVEFNSLEVKHAYLILGKFVKNFKERVKKKKGVDVVFSKRVIDHLVNKGFNKIYGARPLKNILQNDVYEKIADLFLSEGFSSKEIIIDFVDGEIIATGEIKGKSKAELPVS